MINTVKIQGEGYLVNSNLSVPKADGNKDYEAVKKWIEAGGVVGAEFTQGELDQQAISAKWAKIGEFWSNLTVTINNNKYKADEAGCIRIALKRDALATDAVTMWYEDWGAFETNKVELQDVITKADADLQAFINAEMETM